MIIMLQTRPNITQKYCQETRYNYVGNSGFFASNCSPLLCYRFVSTTLTAQIPTEMLSQSHRLCFMLLCYNHAKTTTFSAQSSTGKTCSPLLHYHCVNHANSYGNAIANSQGLLHAFVLQSCKNHHF